MQISKVGAMSQLVKIATNWQMEDEIGQSLNRMISDIENVQTGRASINEIDLELWKSSLKNMKRIRDEKKYSDEQAAIQPPEPPQYSGIDSSETRNDWGLPANDV